MLNGLRRAWEIASMKTLMRKKAMMSVADKPKRKYNWLYIAASFVGLLLVSSVFFKGFEAKKINIDNPIVLEQEPTLSKSEKEEVVHEVVISSQIIKQVNRGKQVVAENVSLKKHSNQLSNEEKVVSISNESKENEVVVNAPENKINQSISKNRYITAEQLLAEVGHSNFDTKANEKTIENRKGISIDPNRLLSTAETELNQTFRETALIKLSKNFNSIKTVLVNRNYAE
jgi:hypothetical protein